MAEKKDKDIWEKLSDAAASAGKTLGDEYQRLKFSHDIWLLGRDLQKAYARVGEIIYNRHLTEGLDVDDKLAAIFNEIEELSESLKKLEDKRGSVKASSEVGAKAGGEAKGETEPKGGEPEEKAEMEFLDEDEIPYFCPECGVKLDLPSGEMPNYCIRCGHSLGTE